MKKKSRREPHKVRGGAGASGETRTPDLLITNQLLYRLSYTSIFICISKRYINRPPRDCQSFFPWITTDQYNRSSFLQQRIPRGRLEA